MSKKSPAGNRKYIEDDASEFQKGKKMENEIYVHPSNDIVGIAGRELSGLKVILCITGSVAAYRAIDLARLLMRHGANVIPVISKSTSGILLSPDLLKWATGNSPVTELTGNLEHVALADYGRSDVIIVYPCTANTIGKMANGIDDTTVTSVLSVAAGSKIPIFIAPAMHEAMYENNFIRSNIEKLKAEGVEFIEPTIEEGKAKIASARDVYEILEKRFTISRENALNLKQNLNSNSAFFKNKKILISAGSTVEHIDPIRIITNTSSGKMGNSLAREAKKRNAIVSLVYGMILEDPESCNKNINVKTSEQMYNAIIDQLKSEHYDIVILAAAVSDYKVQNPYEKKIGTDEGDLSLVLTPTKKIIDEVKKINENIFLVGFKADYKVSNKEIIEKAYKKLLKCNGDMIVANDIGRLESKAGSDTSEVIVINKRKESIHLPVQIKDRIAVLIFDLIEKEIKLQQ